MAYEAKVLAHSRGPHGPALLTAQVRFPRVVLAEVVTHRAVPDTIGDGYAEVWHPDSTTTEDLSKNSASSRAIPLARMVRAVFDDPYVPERFSAAGPGMQEAGFLEGADHENAVMTWLAARDSAVAKAMLMLTADDRQRVFEFGLDSDPGFRRTFSSVFDCPAPSKSVHKQDVNRLLEPWAWVTQVLTADDRGWSNFWALRCDAAAHPAFRRVARMVYLAARVSSPERLGFGEWHLPFVDAPARAGFRWLPPFTFEPDALPDLVQFSAARCAWVSYESHEKDGSPEAMRRTFARLMAGNPKHSSPCEHQATPCPMAMAHDSRLRSNLRGWIQARKLVPGERTEVYAPSDEEVASWGLTTSTPT